MNDNQASAMNRKVLYSTCQAIPAEPCSRDRSSEGRIDDRHGVSFLVIAKRTCARCEWLEYPARFPDLAGFPSVVRASRAYSAPRWGSAWGSLWSLPA